MDLYKEITESKELENLKSSEIYLQAQRDNKI